MSNSNSPRIQNAKSQKGIVITALNNKEKPAYQFTYKNPELQANKIYVQAVYQNNVPNANPYLNSFYNQNSLGINQTSSQYIPSGQNIVYHSNQNSNLQQTRTNNHIQINRGGVVRQNSLYSTNRVNQGRPSNTKVQYKQVHSLSKSKFVPIHPQKFLVNSNTVYASNPINFINKTQTINGLNGINAPVVQNVKKTYVPHHIYNEIPVYQTPNQNREQSNYQQYDTNNDQSQQVLLAYYDKVYRKYEQQKQKNGYLMNKMNQMQEFTNRLKGSINQMSNNQSNKQQTIIQKNKRIDLQKLAKLFQGKYYPLVNEIINKRKNNCLDRIQRLFNQSQQQIYKLSTIRVQQSYSSSLRPV